MERREFLAGVGASLLASMWYRLQQPFGREDPLLVGPLGTWAESIVLEISARISQIRIVTADELIEMKHTGSLLPPRVVLLGALGGRTGLEAASEFVAISRTTKAKLKATVTMPGYWEGRRRMDAANSALRTLENARITTTVLSPEVGDDQTLQTWGEARRAALEKSLLETLRTSRG